MDASIISRIALETAMPEISVSAAIALLNNGATGPFIAHYRKEATGGLDEAKIRVIQDRLAHYREVLDLRSTLIKTLSEQGKLTDELQSKVEGCFSKAELDDMQHQFRPRKKTRALEAIEKGLQPLAEYFWKQEPDARSDEERLDVFVDPAKGVVNREQAWQGAVDIIAEWIQEDFELRRTLREMLWSEGKLVSEAVPAKAEQKTKYNMYYGRRESVTTIPSHRVLAIRRGGKEGVLISSIEGDNAKALEFLLSSVLKERNSAFAPVIEAAVRESYIKILRPMIETEVRTQLKERADREAIKVFQDNLANLLLSPPAGAIVVMGVDWGKGNECSVAVVDESGRLLESARIQPGAAPSQAAQADESTAVSEHVEQVDSVESPVPEDVAVIQASSMTEAAFTSPAASETETVETVPSEAANESADLVESVMPAEPPAEVVSSDTPANEPAQTESADVPAEPAAEPAHSNKIAVAADPRKVVKELILQHKVRGIAIGTGAGARELETFLREILAEAGLNDVFIAAVNDAGIAIYSSSRIAREEFPDSNASARCAVSLARRLQDPLAELVKIDPKLIGVGQYQHDVDQKELHRGLLQTVQFCVNNVGVNVNTAGATLLRYVSGLNDKIARKLVAVRDSQGPFSSRSALKSVLEEAVYQQAAAFLRIPDGEDALDRTGVHPESYPIVEKIATDRGVAVRNLIENKEIVSSINLEDYVTETVGMPTLTDIREELLRPGRDPRRTFKLPNFRADVREMSDLKTGMTLEGTVTNVTNFGAFVDIGVHQDGLIHLSQMSNSFIRDPREAVKVGDVVEVRVISVDMETKRIGLSMKSGSRDTSSRKRPSRPLRRGGRPPAAGKAEVKSEVKEEAGKPKEASTVRFVKSSRPGENRKDGSHRKWKKPIVRKPDHKEKEVLAPQPEEPVVQEPEQSLKEKIAILQSRFRGIN